MGAAIAVATIVIFGWFTAVWIYLLVGPWVFWPALCLGLAYLLRTAARRYIKPAPAQKEESRD